ncbi:hypothetical protein L0Z72_00425 [candidate division KSB1 bacterium]|nr:hypothetical protein [candidate division KSB1 bacterium]
MKAKRIFHIISNTHWDREWRFPFQKNRQMLVEMIDRLLEILEEEPAYRAFHLDSQTVVIEDYLAIRPEKKSLIQRFVREGRLLIGPWFILPDEFQVGGESLVRNLLLGHRIAAELGHVMKVGYSPFSWGQISQFPQIYKEFGIDVVMFYRGINSLDSPKAEFIWEGADGTRVLASRFSTMPRYNFYFYIYRPVIHNEAISDIEFIWQRGGLPFHFADSELKEEDYNLLQPLDNYYPENLQPAVSAIIKDQVDDFTTPHIFWAEGHDSSGPNIKTVQLIKDIKKLLPEDEVIHSTLEAYVQGLKDAVNYEELKLVHGERRSSQFDRRSGNLYGHTTSARMYLKQMNFATEKWLQFYAEPFNVLAGLLGLNVEDKYLDIAWHLLLQNSAHDSIGGCSLDEIHDDMMNRYKQSQEISKGVFARACKFLAQKIDLKNHPEQSIHLVSINPTTYQRNEIVEAFIDIPADLDRGNIKIVDNNGQNVDFQLIEIQDKEPVLEQMIDRPMYFKMKRYHSYIYLKNIPSLGFSTWHIHPNPLPVKNENQISRIENDLPIMENQFLKISLNRNGTIDVFDKENEKSYSNIGYFFDEGEAGHAWVHQAAPPFYDTQKSSPKIALVLNGPLIAVASIHHRMEIPETLFDRKNNGKKVHLPIELNVILKKDSRRVEFEIKLDNTAECHRLRFMFPLGIDAKHSFGEGQFDVVARPIDRPDTSDWLEQPMYDYPMHHFVDLSDDKIGAAVLVDGLKEYEILNDANRTLAITLLRGFNFTIQPSSFQDYSHQKGSQCLGAQRYRLAFYLHSGNWESAHVYREALCYNNEMRLVQIGRAMGKLNPETSFIKIMPENLIFSCLKQSENKIKKSAILRIYNPTEEDIRGTITVLLKLKDAHQVTLEEKYVKKFPIIDEHTLEVQVLKKRIVTLRLIFEE